MAKVWKILPQKQEIITSSKQLVEQLLFNRGIASEKTKKDFFDSQLSDFTKDINIPGIPAAKKRILEAVEKQELIIVYGDYDVDGICGAAVLYQGLTMIGAKVLPYIPHREKEGYGLSEIGLKSAQEKGAKLVITVDNGIVALEQAKLAKKLGMDLIITDHHTALDKKPEALVIVHSTKICGTAVGWCLINHLVDEKDAHELLDLVAVATVGDMVPLKGINRFLVKEGLKVLNQTKRVGLKALIYEAGLKLGEITAWQIGFMIGPRLNAKGRMEHAIDALRLLCTKDIEKASKWAQALSETNDQKKKITMEAIIEAKTMIVKPENSKILVVHSENWIPGIVGLVAGRLSEEYHLPTIALAVGETEAKGSARSVNGVNIVEVIRQCSELLIDVGGHPAAAGFTIKLDKVEEFKIKLSQIMETAVVDQTDILEIEGMLDPKKISKQLILELDRFEPFGIDNPKPTFGSLNIKISDLKTVGVEAKHLKFKADGVEAIAFSCGNLKNILQEGQLINLAFNLELNKFNGSETIQLKVLDMQIN